MIVHDIFDKNNPVPEKKNCEPNNLHQYKPIYQQLGFDPRVSISILLENLLEHEFEKNRQTQGWRSPLDIPWSIYS